MSEWQDIKTAPKDGTDVYLYEQNYYGVVSAHYEGEGEDGEDCWVLTNMTSYDESSVVEHPTHWMPLPPLPEPPSKAGQ